MNTVGANTKLCITCGKYDGIRVTKNGLFVDFDMSDNGKCYGQQSQGVLTKPAYSCSQWIKWAALK